MRMNPNQSRADNPHGWEECVFELLIFHREEREYLEEVEKAKQNVAMAWPQRENDPLWSVIDGGVASTQERRREGRVVKTCATV